MMVKNHGKGSSAAALDLSAYDEVALVLQGGGALGSYQAGVYEGLDRAGIEPSWIAGISIGALNTAIIAGNPPGKRLEALRGFWDTISKPEDGLGLSGAWWLRGIGLDEAARSWSSGWSAMRAILEGQGSFFAPIRPLPLPGLSKRTPDKVSYYSTDQLAGTLARFVDFDRVNDGATRVSVGAVNVRTGNFAYFDNRQIRLEAKHFLASGALPPGFPAIEIDGEHYWDGGLVSNTPLLEILRQAREQNVLAFQIDLWSASGPMPGDFLDVEGRVKDIRFSSRTRAMTDMLAESRRRAHVIKELLDHLPDGALSGTEYLQRAREVAKAGSVNLIHLIYQNKPFERYYKDVEFSRDTMDEHWASGLEDVNRSLSRTDWFELPDYEMGFVTNDIHRENDRSAGSS